MGEAQETQAEEVSAKSGELQPTPLFQAFIKQIFELWLTPELDRRKQEGRWTDETWLQIAQVLFTEDGIEIRINSEVKCKARCDPPEPFKPGEPVYAHQVGRVTAIELMEADGDAGHVTIFNLGFPQIAFDFRRFKKSAIQLAKLALQFLETAAFAMQQKSYGPFADNLFSACELIAKAKLMTMSMVKKEARTHGAVASALNRSSSLSNVDPGFVKIFNRLSNIRAGARYLPGQLKRLEHEEASLDLVRTQIETFIRHHETDLVGDFSQQPGMS